MLPLFSLLAKLLAGPLFDYLKSVKQEELSRDVLQAEIERGLIASQTEIAAWQAKIVMAEIAGEDWLQRNWRPLVALTSFFSYWFVIIAYPFAVKAGVLPQVAFGEVGLNNLFWLTVTAMGGYIAGRSAEKITRIMRT